MFKCYADNANIAKLLVDNGANVNIADENGNTPLHVATKYGKLIFLELEW